MDLGAHLSAAVAVMSHPRGDKANVEAGDDDGLEGDDGWDGDGDGRRESR